eukprot:SAG31_NODE_3597_length_4085_cov_5.800301_4_plen_72_part_00
MHLLQMYTRHTKSTFALRYMNLSEIAKLADFAQTVAASAETHSDPCLSTGLRRHESGPAEANQQITQICPR